MAKSSTSHFDELLISPEFIADPYPHFHRLREEAPVYWSESIGGWILTRYDDVIVTFKDTARYSNEGRLAKSVAYLPPEKRINYKVLEDHYSTKGLLNSDPPDHTRMRSLVIKEFTPRVVEQMRPRIQQTVDDLVDAALAKGEMDVIPDLAEALPVGVIAEILGVPLPDRHLFKKWADDILGFQGVNKPSEPDLSRAQTGLVELRQYLKDMIKERRAKPREDLMSKFVLAESQGQKLSESELINTSVTFFNAGYETTLSAIANTIYTLLANPDQLLLLRENPTLLPAALEESLRFECPIARQTRLMKADAELGGQTLKQGEMVFQMLNAVNRDPAYFKQPDKFDIQRDDNRHLAFGLGSHFCVGATLSRVESLVAVETVLRKMPKLTLVDAAPDWDLGKRNSRVLNTLRVTF